MILTLLAAVESLKWIASAEITVNEQVAAFGEQVGIFVDFQKNKPIRIPERLKQKFQEFAACDISGFQ